MSDVKRFNLPDVGEGLTEAEIVTWKVKVGETIKVNDVVVEIETAKSLVELPSPYAGVVAELMADEGATVNVGSPIIAVETGDVAAFVAVPEDDEAVEPGLIGGPAPGGRTSVLVGYGPRTTEAKRRARKGVTPVDPSPAAAQIGVQHAFTMHATPAPDVSLEDAEPAAPAEMLAPVEALAGRTGAEMRVLAKPPVRKLARDLGIELGEVSGSGPDGTISRDDVERHAGGGGGSSSDGADRLLGSAGPSRGAADATRETRLPVKGVRKVTAQAMVASAFTAPHVTEWVTVDATRTVKLLGRLRDSREFRDTKVSPLLVVARAVCLAVRRTPAVNATWDDAAQEIVLKHYVNLGIAAATPRGLLVPNIKDADSRSALELAEAINELAATARAGRTPPPDQTGGTFTITNVGVFGVDSGTPIINPGEAAILCMGAIRRQPWVVGNAVKPRWVTTLALSFDHRVVDGEQGSMFLADVASVVTDPGQALVF